MVQGLVSFKPNIYLLSTEHHVDKVPSVVYLFSSLSLPYRDRYQQFEQPKFPFYMREWNTSWHEIDVI